MKKKILSALNYLVFFSIGIALIWWQISKMTQDEKTQFVLSLKNLNYFYVIIIVLMGLLSHYIRALRWKLLIDPMGKTSARNAFYAVMIGYLGNTFVPRAGEILRASILSRYEKIPVAKLLGTVIVERLFDMICYLLFIILTVLVQLELVREFVSGKIKDIIFSDVGMPVWQKLLILMAAALAVYFFFRWFFKRYSQNKLVARIIQVWKGLKEGLTTIFHLKKKNAFLIYSLFIWALYMFQIYLGFRTMEATAHLGVGAAMSVLTLSTLAMIISPGGLGAFPVAVQQVLLVYHVENISFGWLVWGVNTIIIILAGSLSFVLMTYQNRNTKPDTPALAEEMNESGAI